MQLRFQEYPGKNYGYGIVPGYSLKDIYLVPFSKL